MAARSSAISARASSRSRRRTATSPATRRRYFHQGESAYFLSVNRNKESLVLNLKEQRGREIFLELVRKADIVLENYRPGVVKRLGIDYRGACARSIRAS